MVYDVAGPEFMDTKEPITKDEVEEPPNPQDQVFFDILDAATKLVYPGCPMIELSLLARLMGCKSDGHQS